MGVGAAGRPLKGDSHCGDQFGHWRRGKRTTLCVVDGLGHGEYAQKAAKAAIEYVAYHLSRPLPEIFSGCNREISNTRGVAMAIAVIDEDEQTLTYAGVGNTRAMIVRNELTGETKSKVLHLMSSYGIVGGGYKSLLPETVRFGLGDLVAMFTDGVEDMIDLSGYDEVLRTDVQILAERLIEDWGRDTDDAAVLIFTSEV